MPESNTQSFSRKASLADFLDEPVKTNKHDKNNSRTSDTIAKHQEEFGHKKRIKP
jgi:hypothetical protein